MGIIINESLNKGLKETVSNAYCNVGCDIQIGKIATGYSVMWWSKLYVDKATRDANIDGYFMQKVYTLEVAGLDSLHTALYDQLKAEYPLYTDA